MTSATKELETLNDLVLLMELPVVEWQDYAHRKWSQLSSHEKGKFSPGSDFKESFDVCWSYLQREEEEVIKRLCSDLRADKEPRAVLFYKEEGNKRFGRKQYTAAAVLYSKAIAHGIPGTEEIAVCFANRSAVLFHLGHYSVSIVYTSVILEVCPTQDFNVNHHFAKPHAVDLRFSWPCHFSYFLSHTRCCTL